MAPTSPSSGALRWVRAAVLGLSCVLLALGAHVLAGGAAPSALTLLVLAVPIGCSCVLATGTRAGPLRIGLVLAAGQVGLHEAFMLAGAGAGCGPATAAGVMPTHGTAAMVHCAGGPAMAGPSTTMVGAHIAAGLATALLLAHGERLLWAGHGWAVRPYLLLEHAGTRPITRSAVLPVVRRGSSTRRPMGGVRRRGPPSVVAV